MKREHHNKNDDPRTLPEWLSLAAALLILVALVGALLIMWMRNQNRPAEFRVETRSSWNAGADFYLPFKVRNVGDRTAQQVRVEGVLESNNPETASTVFDFVPGQGHVEGCLIFSTDPRGAKVRVVSYQEP